MHKLFGHLDESLWFHGSISVCRGVPAWPCPPPRCSSRRRWRTGQYLRSLHASSSMAAVELSHESQEAERTCCVLWACILNHPTLSYIRGNHAISCIADWRVRIFNWSNALAYPNSENALVVDTRSWLTAGENSGQSNGIPASRPTMEVPHWP